MIGSRNTAAVFPSTSAASASVSPYRTCVTAPGNGANGAYNILVGNGGNTLVGGTGRRNLLIAGPAASTLIAGDSDDILIGGTTSYDTEPGMASLPAIMAG